MMMDITRRETLLAAGVAVGLAGCLSSSNDNNRNNENNNTGNNVKTDIFHLPTTMPRPLWAVDDDASGFITFLDSDDDPVWMVDDPSTIAGLESWLSETDFDVSSIVYLETEGPTTCYDEISVSDVAVENDAIVGTAEAVDTSGDDEACGQAFVYPAAFVRVTGDDLPTDATFTVLDGNGNSSEVTTDGRLVDPAKLPGYVRPAGDPPKLETFTCDDGGFCRLERPDGEVVWGEAHDSDGTVTFAMRVHGRQEGDGSHEKSLEFGRGDEVRITMHNVSTKQLMTGNRHKYNLQVLTMDGWKDVRGTTSGQPVGYTDEGIIHNPGDGFEWTFEMTEEGIIAGHPQATQLTVCPDLRPGRYRFVFWEASGEQLTVSFHFAG